jgi:hypothetical protein
LKPVYKNNFLKELSNLQLTDLSQISYARIRQIILQCGIPLTKSTIDEGRLITRARLHKKKESTFSSEKEISYREDFINMNEYQRASVPFQSMFYGCIDIDKINNLNIKESVDTKRLIYATPIYECNIHNFLQENGGIARFTFGVWTVTKPITTWYLIFNNDLPVNDKHFNEDIKGFLNEFEFNHPNEIETIKEHLTLISKEFYREIPNNNNQFYKVSAAYSAYAFQNFNIGSIIYPSKKTEGNSMNIAISPEVVESSLSLDYVEVWEAELTKTNQVTIRPLLKSTNFGEFNSSIEYEPYK